MGIGLLGMEPFFYLLHLTPFSLFWANREAAEVGLVNTHPCISSYTLVHARGTHSINTKAIAGIMSSIYGQNVRAPLLIVLYH